MSVPIAITPPAAGQSRTILIVDEDQYFGARLARAMEARGFEPMIANTAGDGLRMAMEKRPAYAVVDLRLADGDGIDVIETLKRTRDDVRAIILTGYGNIATAVRAIKAGAIDYLAKPANIDEICAALFADPDAKPPPPQKPMSADRVRWEHIQRVFELCDRNVSETARRLGMHRRTLQRILAKRAPK